MDRPDRVSNPASVATAAAVGRGSGVSAGGVAAPSVVVESEPVRAERRAPWLSLGRFRAERRGPWLSPAHGRHSPPLGG